MSTEALPRIVGLTGGIASGKSTVSAIFRELGAFVIDADEVARDVVRPGSEGLNEIVARFGKTVLREDGSLDREALGKVVFSDAAARQDLNMITHPRIGMEMMARAAQAGAEGHPFVIYDAALIVENGLHHALQGLIVVACRPETQLQRIMSRDGLSETDARARIEAQLPLAQKIAVATWVIQNDGKLEDTRAQAEHIYAELTRTP